MNNFTLKSLLWFIGSEFLAQGAILTSAGIFSMADFKTHPVPIIQMGVVFASGLMKWADYSPMDIPVGSPAGAVKAAPIQEPV